MWESQRRMWAKIVAYFTVCVCGGPEQVNFQTLVKMINLNQVRLKFKSYNTKSGIE